MANPLFIETPLGNEGVLTNPFGLAYAHGGSDWALYEGAPIYAAVDGPLILHPMGTWGDGSYGNAVKQRTADGRYTLSAHLSGYASDVYDGQWVQAGKRVGFQGHTGYVLPPGPGGSHLHWGLCRVDYYPRFDASTAHLFEDPLANMVSEADRMALFQKLEEIERFLGGSTGAGRIKNWNDSGNLPLLDCLGQQPAELINFPGVMDQAYGTNNLMKQWRPLLEDKVDGLHLP